MNGDKYENMHDDSIDEEKKRSKGCLTAIIAVILVIGAILYAVCKMAVPVSYKHFNSKRIVKIEKEYAISLDAIVPERYWVPNLAQDTRSCFNFYTDDYNEVMDSFHGESMKKISDESSDDMIAYNCHVRGNEYFTVKFRLSDSKKGRYKGELVSYRDNYSIPTTTQ